MSANKVLGTLLALATFQTLAFGAGLAQPKVRQWTPGSRLAPLIPLTFAGIWAGVYLQARRAGRRTGGNG